MKKKLKYSSVPVLDALIEECQEKFTKESGLDARLAKRHLIGFILTQYVKGDKNASTR